MKTSITKSITGIACALFLAIVSFSACSNNDDKEKPFPASLSPYDMNRPVGFGQGITGGNVFLCLIRCKHGGVCCH